MSTRPSYYLVTSVGGPNYGDELIAATWLRFLGKHAPDADVVVDCVRPDHAWGALAQFHPRVRFTSTLWMMCVKEAANGITAAVDGVTSGVRAAGRPAAVQDLVGSDVVHMVGGGLMNSLAPWACGLLAGVVAAGEESGARTGLTGAGICPQSPEVLSPLRDLVSRLTVADVRDDPSAEQLALDGLSASADDVFLELHASYFRWTDSAPKVMVSAQSDIVPGFKFSADAETVGEFVLRTLRSWGAAAEDVGFIECFRGTDHQVYDMVREQLPGARFYSLDDILDNGLPVREGQSWISTRFHSHLMAASAGLGGVAVSVRPDYYDIKHGSLIERGSRWRFAALDSVPGRPDGGGFAPADLERMRQRKADIARALYGF